MVCIGSPGTQGKTVPVNSSAGLMSPRSTQSQDKNFSIGDKVCVDVTPDTLKELQKGCGGWSMRMNDVGALRVV